MKTKHYLKGIVVFLSAILVLSTSVLHNNLNTKLNAETEIVIDDSPGGEKIVDMSISFNKNHQLFLTENGQVYYYADNGVIPTKVKHPEGSSETDAYLSFIKQISIESSKAADPSLYWATAVSSNGDSIYLWNSTSTNIEKIIPNFKVKKLMVTEPHHSPPLQIGIEYALYIALSETGEVYAKGNCSGSIACGLSADAIDVGDGFYKIEKDIAGNKIPPIEDFIVSTVGVALLTKNGNLLSNLTMKEPVTKTMFREVMLFDNIAPISDLAKLYHGAWVDVIAMDRNSVFYHNYGEGQDLFNFDELNKRPLLPDNLSIINDLDIILDNSNHTAVATPYYVSNNEIYTYQNGSNPGLSTGQGASYSFERVNDKILDEKIVSPYDIVSIAGGYLQGYGKTSYDNVIFLTNKGTVFNDGNKLMFGDIGVVGKKEDGTSYNSIEKYNNSINMSVKGYGGFMLNEISYKMNDHIVPTNSITTETQAEALYSIPVEDEKRIYRTYDFYITGQELTTKSSFTVDLYKKALSLTNVKENGMYPKGKTIALPDNGFSGNTVTATLAKDGGNAVSYVGGSAIDDTGDYVLKATDLYGNTTSYSFSVIDLAVPEGVTFTKGSGELTYGDAITKTNGILGSLSLTYAEGMDTSTIKTLTLGTGGDESNFEVVNTDQLKVKGSDLTAKEYTINVSGTDQNDMAFTGELKITIAKATQTMDFDDATKAFSSGKKMGDVFTLGTQNILDSAIVTYSADSCATISSAQATISCVPSSGKITFTASAATTTNYEAKTVTLDIPVSNLAVSIKTQSLDGTTYEDSVTIDVGDSIPNAKVVLVSPNDFDISKLGTPTFSYKKDGVSVNKPQNSVGTYDVDVSFSNTDGYSITITKGTLVVEGIVLDDSNKDDYYTLSSGGTAYTPDTWTKDPIDITPKHTNFNKMKVDGSSETTSTFTYQSEGTKEVSLSFTNIDGIVISTKVKLNYDKTAPAMQDFTYEKVKSKLRSLFDYFFGEQKTVVFNATDSGSGIKNYDYEIYELDTKGSRIATSKVSGQGESYTLSINKSYEIIAKATDNAGNISSIKSEKVTLSDNIGKLDIEAKSNGKTYDGSSWTSNAIDVELSSTNISGVAKYQYSEDGVVFHDMIGNTISLPSPLANVNNKTYTFRAINNDGSNNDETLVMKVDTDKPVIAVKGKVNSGDYDGSEVGEDVEIVPSQTNASISGITYYYTKDVTIKDSSPLTESKWIKQSGTILESSNGTHTYYVKGVSGSGQVSDVQSITIKILKRSYTSVNVTVKSEGKPYTPDTWAKHDVTFKVSGGIADSSMITGYEYAVTNGERPTSSTTWKSMSTDTLVLQENSKGDSYFFRVLPVDRAGSISKATIVKLDVEKPTTPSMVITPINTSPIAKFVNALSFGQWMKEGVEVSLTSNDPISGIDYYIYSENKAGVISEQVSKTGIISYDENIKVSLQAIAKDKAGNTSDKSTNNEILIDKTPPMILGVKDQGEYKHYYLPRFVSIKDDGSGVKSASYTRDSEAEVTILDEVKLDGIGTYSIQAEDNAENSTMLNFKIVPLPDLDDIDGSDESKDIIDQIQKELDEIKDKIDETESKDYEGWLDDANDKWNNLRKKVIENDDKTSKVEGLEDTSFDPKVELIVEEIAEDELPVLPRKALYRYDVYLRKGSTIIQPNGNIKVSLPYPDKETPVVYEIGKARSIQEIPSQKEGEYVVFVTDTLAKYAISNIAQDEVKEDVVKVPGPDGEMDTKDDVIANPSEKGNQPTKNPDGSVSVPPGGSVTYPDGGVIDTPEGAILHPDGSLTLPDGTEYDPSGKPEPKPDPKPEPDKDINQDSDDDGKPDVNVDVDCDGKADINIDTDDDGIPDIDIDTTGDGKANYNVDIDGDQEPDVNIGPVKWKTDVCNNKGCILFCTSSYYKPYLNIDTDNDMSPDVNVDIDNDNFADINIDIDRDNIPDIDIDSDGDTVADINVDTDDDGRPNRNLALITKWTPNLGMDTPIVFDTMGNIKVDNSLTPDTWYPSNKGESSDTALPNDGQQENKDSIAGTSTGDTTATIGIWLMFFISGGISYGIHCLKKKFKA